MVAESSAASSSWPADTVTVRATAQSAGVKVSVSWSPSVAPSVSTVRPVPPLAVSVTVTSADGRVASLTAYVPTPPSPRMSFSGDSTRPGVSLSLIVTGRVRRTAS